VGIRGVSNLIGFHFDDTEWDKEKGCFKEESLYDTDGKIFKRPNHDKIFVYNGKTGCSMEDKREEE
jgi:hypothetical protein